MSNTKHSIGPWFITEGPTYGCNSTLKVESPATGTRAYITAQSWNGEWFYYNVIQDTWEWSATTTPGTAHHADDNDMTAAKECAVREQFAAINIAIDHEVEA